MALTAGWCSLARNTVQQVVNTSHAPLVYCLGSVIMSSFATQLFSFRQPNPLAVRVAYNDFNRALQEKDLNHVSSEAFDGHAKEGCGAEDHTGRAECKNQEIMQLAPCEDEASEDDQPCNETTEEVEENADDSNKTQDEDKVEDERTSETFVAVIAQSILSVPSRRMTLSSIYNHIAKNYPHFDKEKGPGWRNSVRHNLSSNDCFVKASRAENGKGHYWMIHPKDLPEFSKGNFRRRRKPRRPKCSHSLMFRESAAYLLHSAYQSVHSAAYPYTQVRSHHDVPHFMPARYAAAERSLAQAFRSRMGLLSPASHVDPPCTAVSHHTSSLSYPMSSLRFGETSGAVRTYPNYTPGGPLHYPCACHR